MTDEDVDRVIAEVRVSPEDRLIGGEIARKRHAQRWTLPVFAGVLALVAVLVHDWVLAVLLGGTAVGVDFYARYAARRSWDEPATAYSVRVTPMGVTVTGSLSRSELQWAAITDVVEIPPLLVFEYRRRQVVIMPLRELTREQVTAITQAHAAARSISPN